MIRNISARTYFVGCAVLVFLVIASHTFYNATPFSYTHFGQLKEPSTPAELTVAERVVLNYNTPQEYFRNNLRKDTKYITTWSSSGFTNDYYSLLNLLYLALLTDRVPILPDFAAGHPVVYGGAPPLPIADVFDIPRLSRALRIPILTWADVKDISFPATDVPVEPLGCWSLHTSLASLEGVIRTPTEAKMGIDVSYWPITSDARVVHATPATPMANLLALAALSWPDYRERALARKPHEPSKAPKSGEVYEPSDHLQCFDYLFFAGTYSQDRLEYYEGFSPVWQLVGRYTYFNPTLVSLSRAMLHRALSLPAPKDSSDTPAFIAVHVRRGDFASWCSKDMPKDDCFAPLSDYAAKVEQVRSALAARGVKAEHVIVGSDERDPAWWKKVAALGWSWVDHEKEDTEAVYGKWYPAIIDQTVHSLATGFVGTDRSTYSLVSRKRVEAWSPVHETRNVLWGKPGSNS